MMAAGCVCVLCVCVVCVCVVCVCVVCLCLCVWCYLWVSAFVSRVGVFVLFGFGEIGL